MILKVIEYAHCIKKRLDARMVAWDGVTEEEIVLLCLFYPQWSRVARVPEDYFRMAGMLRVPYKAEWEGSIKPEWWLNP